MLWWRWIAGTVEAVILLVLVLLVYDSLRERRGWRLGRATRASLLTAIIIPAGVLAVLLTPFWVGLILIAVPALLVGVLALAN